MPHRRLNEIGLGAGVQAVLYAISVLPLVGLVIGGSYMTRRNAATRELGQRLVWYSVLIHCVYVFCICPASGAWVLTQ